MLYVCVYEMHWGVPIGRGSRERTSQPIPNMTTYAHVCILFGGWTRESTTSGGQIKAEIVRAGLSVRLAP